MLCAPIGANGKAHLVHVGHPFRLYLIEAAHRQAQGPLVGGASKHVQQRLAQRHQRGWTRSYLHQQHRPFLRPEEGEVFTGSSLLAGHRDPGLEVDRPHLRRHVVPVPISGTGRAQVISS